MSNMLTSRTQKLKQYAKLQARARTIGNTMERSRQKQEDYFVKRLSQELGVDLKKIINDTEEQSDKERDRMQPKIDRQKQEVKKFALRNQRRLDQTIKTFDKQGLIKAAHLLYPNHPNLRMKFAYDWSGRYEPSTVPGIGEGALADVFFDPELDHEGELLINPGHDGLCKRFRAYAHARVGNRRFGHKIASTEQALVFKHDPPESYARICTYEELWVPMTLTGMILSRRSDAIFFTQSLAYSGGGVAEVRLSITVEQDTDSLPLSFTVVNNHIIHSSIYRGGVWLFGGLTSNEAMVDDGPGPIDVEITEPYRTPIYLLTADNGGGEVRVIVKLECYVEAQYRNAEAEIDLNDDGCGVTIHEVLLRGFQCL